MPAPSLPCRALHFVLHTDCTDFLHLLPDDLEQKSEADVWSYMTKHLADFPDIREAVEDAIKQDEARLPKPQLESEAKIGRFKAMVLPRCTRKSLRIETCFAVNQKGEQHRRTATPPSQAYGTALNVALVLGTFMDVGRVQYDQLPARDLRKLSPIASKFREYTATNSFHDEKATGDIQRELHELLVPESDTAAVDLNSDSEKEEHDIGESSEDVEDFVLHTSSKAIQQLNMPIDRLLRLVFQGTRQVEFTQLQCMVCPSKTCPVYGCGEAKRSVVAMIPPWAENSRRYPGVALGVLLETSLRPPADKPTKAQCKTRTCQKRLAPQQIVLDGFPLRLLLTTPPFTSAELAHDKAAPISFTYTTPAKQVILVHYRWFAIICREGKRNAPYALLIRPSKDMIYQYRPSSDPTRIKASAMMSPRFWESITIVARVYEQYNPSEY